ncbi:MAG: bifunctional UDP-N-acetylmuramoyl-tripeptide:D-alanyl-D-alanine ligase/alanine racemase [Bacteroidota bacterium]
MRDLAPVVGGTALLPHPEDTIRELLIDSRKVGAVSDALFFALTGPRNDGHDYISELIGRGVRNFVVSRVPEPVDEAINFLVVPDTRLALQALTAWHRSRFDYPVFGITGSNGKTVIKEWLYQLLSPDQQIVRSPRSYNSQVGVPLSVWNMRPGQQLGLFEAGISRPGEMAALAGVIQPTLGLFTNIGTAHDENFSDVAEKIREKLRLFHAVGHLFYCADHVAVAEAIKADPELSRVRQHTWGEHAEADLRVVNRHHANGHTRIAASIDGQEHTLEVPFTDAASLENAMHCWLVMLHLGYALPVIQQRILQLSAVAMRLELKEGINRCTVINDSYNSDMGSLRIALDLLRQQRQHNRFTVILSDILQSGRTEPELYAEVARMVAPVDRLIGIGPAISRQQERFSNKEQQFFPGIQAFLDQVGPGTFHDEAILLKGARAFGFEAIGDRLQQQLHETVLEIRLDALVHNLNHFRSRLDQGTRLMVMVKAFSYGSGSFEIANLLQFHRVDYLAVAYADEGVLLRQAGIELPIMVMSPEERTYPAMVRHRLEPEVFDAKALQAFEQAVTDHGKGEKHFPIHLKLDTGMHRLGFGEEELESLVNLLATAKHLRVASVFSHLAGSDESGLDDFTRKQLARFETMSQRIRSGLNYPVMRHILNSAGIQRFPEAQFDMVRLGIGLYGVGVNPETQQQLLPVSTLKTVVSQVRRLPAGETVGYGRKGVLERDSLVATVPIGYADGLSRRLSNGAGAMWVHGQRAPIMGNVCMDMCMLDVTGIPVEAGDEVIVFGEPYTISELAADLETIPYEVLTGISTRVKRVYLQE